MENHAILSLEFNVQHWMEQIFNLEAIALHKTNKPALKMLDNYAIILDNWIGAILRINGAMFINNKLFLGILG